MVCAGLRTGTTGGHLVLLVKLESSDADVVAAIRASAERAREECADPGVRNRILVNAGLPAAEPVTTEQFDAMLEAIVAEQSASVLLGIPAVYEVLSEYFNNDVLDRLAQQQPW